jgi:hypothetical protein
MTGGRWSIKRMDRFWPHADIHKTAGLDPYRPLKESIG